MTINQLRQLEEEKQNEHWHQVRLVSELKRRGIVYNSTPNENKFSGIIRTVLIGLYGKAKGLKLANKIIYAIESKMKAEGKRKGFPDLTVYLNNKVLYIEMKKMKGGTVSPEQKIWIESLNTLSYAEAKVCLGWRDAWEWIESHIPKKARENEKQSNIYDYIGADDEAN